MKRKFIFQNVFIAGCLLISFPGCKDYDLSKMSTTVQLQESLAIPVGEDSISVNDILLKMGQNQNISTNVDTINFVENFSAEYKYADYNLTANIQPAALNVPLLQGSVAANSEILLPGNSETLNLGLDPTSVNQRVDSAWFSTLQFGFSVSVSGITQQNGQAVSPSDLRFSIGFPNIHPVGNYTSLSRIFSVNQFGQPYFINFSNVILDTFGLTGMPFTIHISSGINSLIIGHSAQISINFTINQMTYTAIYGMFALQSFGGTSMKAPLAILNQLSGGLAFANPQISVTLHSNIGSQLKFTISKVMAFDKNHTDTVYASFDGQPSTYEIVDVKPASPGLTVTKTLQTLDKNYGTTDRLFSPTVKFDTLQYNFLTESYRPANATTPDFVIPGMKLDADFNVKIPFYLKAGSNLSLNDTISNLSLPFDNISEGSLILTVTNALPVKLSFKMKFQDVSGSNIVSAFNDSTFVVNSAKVDNNGLTIGSTVSKLIVPLSKTDAVNLKNANRMIFTVAITGNSQTVNGVTTNYPIQITTSNYLKVKLGVFLKAGVHANLK